MVPSPVIVEDSEPSVNDSDSVISDGEGVIMDASGVSDDSVGSNERSEVSEHLDLSADESYALPQLFEQNPSDDATEGSLVVSEGSTDLVASPPGIGQRLPNRERRQPDYYGVVVRLVKATLGQAPTVGPVMHT